MEDPPEVCPWERLRPRPAVARGFTALHFGAARAHDSHTCLRVFPLPVLSRGVFKVTKRSGSWSTHSQETAGGPVRTATGSPPSADSRPLACSASHGLGSRHCQLGPVRVRPHQGPETASLGRWVWHIRSPGTGQLLTRCTAALTSQMQTHVPSWL